MSTRKAAGTKGFTLVELLTVVAVIAVLSAVFFAVFARVRESGRRTVCQSNLKQIALAMQQYVQDNGSRYPVRSYVVEGENVYQNRAFGCQSAILPYLKDVQIFRCPSQRQNFAPGDYLSVNNEVIAEHYAYNDVRLNVYEVLSPKQ
jgi:prepilin-type N-terminal cleavage/methylation domain-containing protein